MEPLLYESFKPQETTKWVILANSCFVLIYLKCNITNYLCALIFSMQHLFVWLWIYVFLEIVNILLLIIHTTTYLHKYLTIYVGFSTLCLHWSQKSVEEAKGSSARAEGHVLRIRHIWHRPHDLRPFSESKCDTYLRVFFFIS